MIFFEVSHVNHTPYFFYICQSFQMLLCLYHTHVLGVLQKLGGKDEFIQQLVLGKDNLLAISAPFFFSIIQVQDIVSNLHHTIHVMCIDDGGGVVFYGDFLNQFVYHHGGLRV